MTVVVLLSFLLKFGLKCLTFLIFYQFCRLWLGSKQIVNAIFEAQMVYCWTIVNTKQISIGHWFKSVTKEVFISQKNLVQYIFL